MDFFTTAFHQNKFIHRDIKPENFVVGNPDTKTIYLIVFLLESLINFVKSKYELSE